jgi:hypothetical protein
MPRIRYYQPTPARVPAVTAFAPVPAKTTAVYAYKEDIEGQPGTAAVPAPPQYWTDPHLPSGGDGSGDYMPPWWFPSLYYQRGAAVPVAGIGGVRVYSDNLMPMPAMTPSGLPAGTQQPVSPAPPRTLARPRRTLGQFQTLWPSVIQRWINVNG